MNEKGKILIVDDDQNTCKTLSLILRKKGYKVGIAQTGQEALEKMENEPVNLVLLDIRLPDMEGIELLSKWKKKYLDTDTIMITGYASVDYSIEAVNQGAAAFLIKPLIMEQLLALIKSLMEKQKLR